MADPLRSMSGIVVSSGRMIRAVRVRVAHQVYNSFLRKVFHPVPMSNDLTSNELQHFQSHSDLLVSDPTNSTRTGDVVRIADEGQVSWRIKHVVREITTPWGTPLEERPALPTREERLAQMDEKKQKKLERRANTAQGHKEASQDSRAQYHDSKVPGATEAKAK